jgi:hypothetical protein
MLEFLYFRHGVHLTTLPVKESVFFRGQATIK